MRICKSIIITITAIFAWLYAGAEDARLPLAGESTINTVILDVAEAVFRYQFGRGSQWPRERIAAYYLLLFRKDPNDDFLARFQTLPPSAPIRKGSEFKIGKGVQYDVATIKEIRDNLMEVDGGGYFAELDGYRATYLVEKKIEGWTVATQSIYLVK